jgi:hypothetical protein
MRQKLRSVDFVLSCVISLLILTFSLSAAAQRGKYEEPFVDPMADKPSANKDHFYFGGYMGLGQAYSTESDDSPGLTYLVGLDPGYAMTLGSWSRMEVGADVFFGKASFRLPADEGGKVDLPIGFGLLAKLGYGYSMGNNLFGVWKFGVGPVQAKYADENVKSKDAMTGIAGQLEFGLLMPISDKLDGTGSFRWTYMDFDLGDVDYNGTTVHVGRHVIVDVPQFSIGLRMKI